MGRQRLNPALQYGRRHDHRQEAAELPPPVDDDDPAFVMLVKTDNAGTSGTNQMTLPLTGTYDIDWGDGVVETLTGTQTHTYPAPGQYTIRITGGLQQFFFNNTGDRLKLLEIQNWGDIAWVSMNSAFYGCANMILTATDAPNLSSVTLCTSAFRSTTLFNTDISHWDVSNVTNMSTMFVSAVAFDHNLGGWNMTNVTNAANMFTFITLSPASYGATLIGWAAQTLKSGVSFHGGNSKYPTDGTGNPATDAAAARAKIIADFGWTFTDGGPV